MHDAIMTKEEEAVIKTRIIRQRPGSVQMQRMEAGCADGDNERRHVHEPARTLRPPWKKQHWLDSRHEQAGSHQPVLFPGATLLVSLAKSQHSKTLLFERFKLCTALC